MQLCAISTMRFASHHPRVSAVQTIEEFALDRVGSCAGPAASCTFWLWLCQATPSSVLIIDAAHGHGRQQNKSAKACVLSALQPGLTKLCACVSRLVTTGGHPTGGRRAVPGHSHPHAPLGGRLCHGPVLCLCCHLLTGTQAVQAATDLIDSMWHTQVETCERI